MEEESVDDMLEDAYSKIQEVDVDATKPATGPDTTTGTGGANEGNGDEGTAVGGGGGEKASSGSTCIRDAAAMDQDEGSRRTGGGGRDRDDRDRSDSDDGERRGGGRRRDGGRKRSRSPRRSGSRDNGDEDSDDGGGRGSRSDDRQRRRSSRDHDRGSDRYERDRYQRRDRDRDRHYRSSRRSRSRSPRSRSRSPGGGGGGRGGYRGDRRDYGRGRYGRDDRGPRVIDHRGSPPWHHRRGGGGDRGGGGGRDGSPQQQRRQIPGPERRDVLGALSMPFSARHAPPKDARLDMSTEERDERTIFILQLHQTTRPRDLEEFFSSVGTVRDVRIITDSKTRRSKGIAYVEFWEREAVPLAMGLNGQKLLNRPLTIQMTCAERNRAANGQQTANIGLGLVNTQETTKLKVSNLHLNITDDMLIAIFEPFGKVESCVVEKDSQGSSKGYGYVIFRRGEEGRRALEQLNMFELAGKNIRLEAMVEEAEQETPTAPAPTGRKVDDRLEDRYGRHDRQQLMAKLAEGTGMDVPQYPTSAQPQQQPTSTTSNWPTVQQPAAPAAQPQPQVVSAEADSSIPAIATQCFMLSNMFDPAAETEPTWELDVRDDVIEECNNNGGVVHIYVDKASPQGNVYVKCPNVGAAHRSVTALHGRWFAGKVITANYVPVESYHQLFPESSYAQQALQPRSGQ